MKSKIAEKIYNETPDSIKDEVRAYANKIVDEYYDSKKESDFEENALLEIDRLNEELKQRDETIKQLRDEIANHIAVNSLLTDSDGEADLANKLYNIQSELKRKDSEILALESDKETMNVAHNRILERRDLEIQQLKEALREMIPLAEIGLSYESQKFYDKYNPIIEQARKLIELNEPQK